MKLNWKTTPPDKPGDYVECWRDRASDYYSTVHVFEDSHSKKLKVTVSGSREKTILLSTYVKNCMSLNQYWLELTPP